MKELSEKLQNQIALLPSLPGVYQMKDENDKIIYIGKAKNLQKRVSQYFLRPQVGKVAAMVSHIDHFDYIIVHTDKEAFILEMNLIQTYYPRYNIMLMDDSHYPYIAVKKNDGFLKIARNTKDKNYFYYGPFPNSKDAYKTIDLLNSLYPTRKCKTLGKKACLYYHMGQCYAPCEKKIDPKVTESLYTDIRAFLDGDISKTKSVLKEKIEKASKEERYEDASFYYETLKSLEETVAKQNVEISSDKTNRDIIGFAYRDSYLCLTILTYRRGILLGKKSFVIPTFSSDATEIAELAEEYYQEKELPNEIACNIPSFDEEFGSVYPEVRIVHPKEGRLLSQIDLATLNARESLDAHFGSARLEDDKLALLEELGKLLNIATPYRIELFDNSHLEGSNAVGAMVCFINGERAKKMYRKFRLSSEVAGDDYHSLKEVVYRRYKRLKEEKSEFPSLILADGGINQVHATYEALEELGISIPVFGLYKNERHETEGIIDRDENIYPLGSKTPLFFLLMRMQDEVHRFAISYHKSLRGKNMGKSIFDNVRGIGEKRKETLRKHYPTLESLQKTSLSELEQLLPKEAAMALLSKVKELS